MATFGEETDLVVRRVSELGDVAREAYNTAKGLLDTLAESIEGLPLSLVDVDIDTTVDVSWNGTVSTPAPVTIPTYLDNALEALPDAPTVPTTDVTIPTFEGSAPGELSDTLEDVTATLPDTPSSIDAPTFDAIADLGDIPEVSAVVPTIDLDVLDTAFSFTEPTYTVQISDDVKTELMRVLGGDLGIPSSVWSAMWVQVAGDLARQQVGRLRTARNRGAASYWALPTETVLAASKAIADEGARSMQIDKLQKAVSEATMKREDFWQAVQQGLALEGMWIGFHESMAQRALGAAEQLANIQISVHNANVQRYNLLIENAKLAGTIDDMKINRLIRGYEVQVKKSEIEVTQSKAKIEHFQAMWEGYKAQTQAISTLASAQTERFSARTNRGQLAVQRFGQEIQYWSSLLDAELKSQGFLLQRAETESKNFATQYGAIDSLASATSAMVNSQVQTNKMILDGELAVIDAEKSKNMVNLELGKLKQSAQETKANIEIAQAEWIAGQAYAMQQRIAELAFGYAQAAISASQVSLGSSVGMSESIGYDASMNAEKVWSVEFTG